MTNIAGLRIASARFNDFDGESWWWAYYFSQSWSEARHITFDQALGNSWEYGYEKSTVYP